MKKIKEIKIKKSDDNGLSKQLMDFFDNSFDSGLSTKEELKIEKKIIKKNGFIYDFNFWVKVLGRIGCEQYDNTTIVVHPEDKRENRFLIDSDLDSLWFVLIGRGYRIESNKYKFDDVFTIMNKFEEYQELYFNLIDLKK